MGALLAQTYDQISISYESGAVNVRPIVEAVFHSDPNGSVPNPLEGRLSWNGGAFGSWVSFGTTGHSAGDNYLLSFQVSSAVTSSGWYPWTVEVRATFGSDTLTRSLTGKIYVTALTDSASTIGHGWSLAGLDKLVDVTSGIVWVYGSGGSRYFELVSGSSTSYLSPVNDYGALVKNGDNTWTYTAKDQIQWKFDTGGKLSTVTDPLGFKVTYTYNDEGNLVKKSKGSSAETWTYVYDEMNQLVTVQRSQTDGGAVDLQVDFKYDVFGNRIEKSYDPDGAGGTGATVTRFAYDGWKNVHGPLVGNENWDVWADLNGSSSLTTRYIRGDVIDQVYARIDSGTTYWYLVDHLGSIREIINNSAVVKDAITYDVFGNITTETDSSFRGRYAWTGRELETVIGLQYNRGRWYDSLTSRWISQDPLSFIAGDTNLYRYVHNAATVATDPSGLDGPPPGWEGHPGPWVNGDWAGKTPDPRGPGSFNWGAALRVVGSVVALATMTTPVGWVGAIFYVVAFGVLADQAITGTVEIVTGSQVNSQLNLGLQSLGANQTVANVGEAVIVTGVTFGYSAYSRVGSAARGRPLLCFPAGTPVHTSGGLKPIEWIAAGDKVWAYDHKLLRWAEREVVEVFKRFHSGPMATIRVRGETIQATGGHPFWVVRGEALPDRPRPVRISAYEEGGRQQGRWVLAQDLRAGDEVLLRQGELVPLESVRVDDTDEPVYNFNVAELQNYAVGSCGVLVHNTNEDFGPLGLGSQGFGSWRDAIARRLAGDILSRRATLRSLRDAYDAGRRMANVDRGQLSRIRVMIMELQDEIEDLLGQLSNVL